MKAFYLIDKPQGITSFDVLRNLRKKLNIRKMGHTGTLDPLATGALLVAIGNYTRLIPYFEKDIKQYEFTVGLDGVSESFDSETPIEYISHEQKKYFQETLKQEDIQKILEEKFTGALEQMPPKYSAIKMGGKKALDMVRAGEDFEMKTRSVIIHDIEILSFHYPDIVCRATVSAGTYIRSIAFDLGEILTTGGYIKTLRRTLVGKLDVKDAQSLDDFDIQDTLSGEMLFGTDRFIELDQQVLSELDLGRTVAIDLDLEEDKDYFVKNNTHISNVVSYNNGILKPVKKIV